MRKSSKTFLAGWKNIKKLKTASSLPQHASQKPNQLREEENKSANYRNRPIAVLFLPLFSSAESFSSDSSKEFCEHFSGERADLDTLLCSGSSLDLQAQEPAI